MSWQFTSLLLKICQPNLPHNLWMPVAALASASLQRSYEGQFYASRTCSHHYDFRTLGWTRHKSLKQTIHQNFKPLDPRFIDQNVFRYQALLKTPNIGDGLTIVTSFEYKGQPNISHTRILCFRRYCLETAALWIHNGLEYIYWIDKRKATFNRAY